MGIFGSRISIRMTHSVAGEIGEFIAGKQYKVRPEIADRFIARGYALGSMSREFSVDEMQGLKGNSQSVSVGG